MATMRGNCRASCSELDVPPCVAGYRALTIMVESESVALGVDCAGTSEAGEDGCALVSRYAGTRVLHSQCDGAVRIARCDDFDRIARRWSLRVHRVVDEVEARAVAFAGARQAQRSEPGRGATFAARAPAPPRARRRGSCAGQRGYWFEEVGLERPAEWQQAFDQRTQM